jgi:hypothetical protein
MEPIEGIPGQFWEDEFDLSALSYSQFLDFFFDRPILPDHKLHKLFLDATDRFLAAKPPVVAGHVQEMCRKFSELTKVYSPEQLDQGLWLIFGCGISCEQYLFDTTVDLALRIDCIESMYLPFRDVVAHSAIDKRDSFYWMWWDMILHTFWQMADKFDYMALARDPEQTGQTIYQTMLKRALEFDYAALWTDGKQMVEAMYQTLVKTLALDHAACRWSALHGLGHLHHPLGKEVVQNYLEAHRGELSDEDLKWVEACRDGAIA